MVANANLTAKTLAASNLQPLTQKVSNLRAGNNLMETVEKFSVVGAVVGFVAATVYQQMLLAIPLSVSFCLSHLNNRRRLNELLQQNQAAIEIVSSVRKETEANTAAIATQGQEVELAIAQTKKQMLPRQALAAITSKIGRLDNQRIIVEKSLGTQLVQSQQDIAELANQIAALVYQLNCVQLTGETHAKNPLTAQMPKGQRGRVAIFIDGANLYHALVEKGWEIDYAKLLNLLTNNGDLVNAYFYTGVNRNQPNQERFLSYLRYLGYQIIEKEVVQFSDGSKKANLDVELALDMVKLAGSYDTAVLVSGDGDFTRAVNDVKQEKLRVEVVSFRSVTNKGLMNAGDRYLDLDTMKNQICIRYRSQNRTAPLA